MSDKDLQYFDGTDWQSLSEIAAANVEVTLPIGTDDGSIILGQAIDGLYDALEIVEGTQFVIVINEATKLKLSEDGSLFLFGTSATTFFNKSEDLACFAKFESSRTACFVGTESFSPFVVKDKDGANTLISVNSVGIFAASGDIKTNDGRFRGQAFTTNSAEEGDPEIRMDSSSQQIEMDAAGKLCVVVNENYVRSMVDIQTVGIAGRNDPTVHARIDLGEDFKVSKGDGTERFSVNAQSGQIKQTTNAYTAQVINGSNATGALIKTACGGGTYSFGTTNLGWIILDSELNPLLLVSDTDIKAPADYEPQTDDSLVTKGWVSSEIESATNSGGGGDTIPGNGGNSYWQKVSIVQPRKKNSEPDIEIQDYGYLVACDGIFTDGIHWTVDGENWNTSNQGITRGLFKTVDISYGIGVVKSSAEGLYYTSAGGGYYSYDMKQWEAAGNTFRQAYYFDGKIRSELGEFYFDVTTPGKSSSDRVPQYPSYLKNQNNFCTNDTDGNYAMSVLFLTDGTKGLFSLSPDDESDDWGWEAMAIPNDDDPLNVIFARGRWWVFCASKVYTTLNTVSPSWTTFDLPVSSNWNLLADDGQSLVAANDESSVSVFLQGGSNEFKLSTNFINKPDLKSLAGTNGRTIFSMDDYETTQEVENDDGTTDIWIYSVREYYRSGIGNAFDNEDLILGGGSLVPSNAVHLTEKVNTDENNWLTAFPTRRVRADDKTEYDYPLAPEPAILETQEQTNSYFNNKLSIVRHEQVDLQGVVSGHATDIATNTETAVNASSSAKAAMDKATQNEGTIAGNTVAIEKNSSDIAKIENITPIVTLTQAEYDALADIDNETIYMITPV